ncbi:MAG: SAM-dependent methyltransferase [Rhodobacterales bacterium 32-66-7]|nr:MAG: SAM-dependent methyltransferase [Rhodobacterales bacterium 12-65-15]OYX26850.1 MAG: SAM-dependent methyltransferase [Rhodobacterales bacterium 32-66-7]
MTPGARASAAMGVLDQVLAGAPVERVLTNWARGARYAGSSDRAALRDIVFQCLRCRSSYAALGGGLTGRGLVLGYIRSLPEARQAEFFTGGPHDPLPPDPVSEAGGPPVGAEAFNIPDWLETPLRRSLGDEFGAVMAAMSDRAPVFLRVNPLKASPSEAVQSLAAEGISVAACPGLPLALEVVSGERRLGGSAAYAAGLVELQDLSSQAVVASLPLRDGIKVLDQCAGGGGKTLAMAAMAGVRLYAHDANPRRMADLPERARRAGVAVTILDEPEREAPFDLVLVDAPCSGSGSWRRDPAGKWALTEARLAELLQIQQQILRRAAAMVGPGGWLGYATCSLLAAENDDQVAAFLAAFPGWSLTRRLVLTPLSGGDGFFLAVLQPPSA